MDEAYGLGGRRFDRWATGLFAMASLGLLLAWPVWRLSDATPMDVITQTPEAFQVRAEAFAAAHGTGERDGMPLVRPPPGTEIPVIARRFQFWPALELKAGQIYRLRVATVDTVHSVAIAGHEMLLVPGEARLVEVTPDTPGPLPIQCGEYCGLGHNSMRNTIQVLPP